jgi:putative NADH-flavin reductase
MVTAMADTGTRRIVAVSAAPVGPPDAHDTWPQRHIGRPLLWRFLADAYRDMAAMEDTLRASDLDWTVLRPPRLTDKPATGRYRTAVGHNLRKGRFLSRADLAGAILRTLDDPDTVKAAVAVAY